MLNVVFKGNNSVICTFSFYSNPISVTSYKIRNEILNLWHIKLWSGVNVKRELIADKK